MRGKIVKSNEQEDNNYGFSRYIADEKPRLNLNDLLKRKSLEAKNDKKANTIIFAGVAVLAVSVILILSL